MSDWFSAEELLKEWKIKIFELVDLATKGLQPYDEFKKKIPPPNILAKKEQLEKRVAELIIERDQYYKNKCAANERTEHYRVLWMEKKEEFAQYKIDLRSSKEICPRAFRRVGHFRTVPFE